MHGFLHKKGSYIGFFQVDNYTERGSKIGIWTAPNPENFRAGPNPSLRPSGVYFLLVIKYKQKGSAKPPS
jgi:hypothetical protein